MSIIETIKEINNAVFRINNRDTRITSINVLLVSLLLPFNISNILFDCFFLQNLDMCQLTVMLLFEGLRSGVFTISFNPSRPDLGRRK